MTIEKQTIAFIWMGGIGIAAILSTLMLISKRTEHWSEKKIVSVSGTISILVVALIIFLT
ncbi:MAG: hypothetical protein V3V92_02710 [Candidatus Hydrothermarchaeales archaeon]